MARYEVETCCRNEDGTTGYPRQIVEAATPLAALDQFQGTSTEVTALRDAEPTGPEPKRILKNWEKDQEAEVSDGWLSNAAADISNARAELAHRPAYHAKRLELLVCVCGQEVRPRISKWGVFYPCDCGRKWNRGTKKTEARPFVFRYSCGRPLAITVNSGMVPYQVCPDCNPELADTIKRPVGDFMAGRIR